jgi:hypothetical protein
MAAVYDVDLTEAMRELSPESRESLSTILLHLVMGSIAKKRMTLVRLHGPVYPPPKMSLSVVSND